ncbi:hypothetical protein GBA52_009803 [Prunus armeniaca]|nr:hypothetical protein GBA52_009803 [Prunus armeniaca]
MQLMLGSLVRLVTALIARPAATITTLLYHSDLLPRNFNSERLQRLVRHNDSVFWCYANHTSQNLTWHKQPQLKSKFQQCWELQVDSLRARNPTTYFPSCFSKGVKKCDSKTLTSSSTFLRLPAAISENQSVFSFYWQQSQQPTHCQLLLGFMFWLSKSLLEKSYVLSIFLDTKSFDFH